VGTVRSSVRPSLAPRQLRFLVADDDEHVRGVVSRVLARTFPEAVVEAVADGTKALASLEWHTPTLALIDLDMPGLNGIEVVASLRSLRTPREMSIVVITGTGTPSDLRLLQQLGTQAFLVKPFHPSQLVSTARSTLDGMDALREGGDGADRR
jgi:CheY-like chemotaxis protein